MSGVFALRPPPPGKLRRVTGLCGSAEALALAELAGHRRVVALVRDAAAAARLAGQLGALLGADAVRSVAGWEVLPYEATSPPRALVSARLAALGELRAGAGSAFVLAAHDALLPCMPPAQLAGSAYRFAVGDRIDAGRLAGELAAAGNASVDRVRRPGEFAAYGGQLDLYPGGVAEPYRLVFDGDVIEQIRTFDPGTQLSTGKVGSLVAAPACEYPLTDQAVVDFRRRWRERFGAVSDPIYEQISRGEPAEGAQFYLPLFFDGRADVLDYLRADDVLWLHDGLEQALGEFWRMAAQRCAQAKMLGRPVLEPAALFASPERLWARAKRLARVKLCPPGAGRAADLGARPLPPLAAARGADEPYARLARWLAARRGRTVFAWSGQARRKRVLAALAKAGAAAQDAAQVGGAAGIYLLESPLSGGFEHAQAQLAVVTEAELHAYAPAPGPLRAAAVGAGDFDLQLQPGDLVVHEHHGVAKFRGLKMLGAGAGAQEFVGLEFAGEVMLYVAVAHCHLLARYRQPEPGAPVVLHRIGSKRWQRQRAKAQQAARDTAAYLLDLHAQRRRARAPARVDEDKFAEFCAAFSYAETADQAKATAEVVADLCAPRPMDRLLCGDVGFGKTEIALRAAWVAAANGRQVAVLAPTTLLADQLARCFVERFAGSATAIVELSSLRSKQECAEAVEQLKRGRADIVVGTHALFEQRVQIPNLGLLIIDEEHRFGVRQKERLRELRARADVLALSATPIPRTLAMALEGLRDMSVIATPPADRLAVRTQLAGDDDHLVADAIARELVRGGQVFYVHHRVQSIHVALERVRELAPAARTEVAHGQMPHRKLEQVMRGFYRGEIDVLVCTTIIESGIDVPNANTMIVPRADLFGLAQLHQLRGRVGRSARQAYVYFLTTAGARDTGRQAAARLATLASSAQLGGGYYIAVRDMEIRGAGEILGEAQSGAVAAIGIEAFRRLLDKAARAARGSPAAADCQIDFGGSARLPANYCANAVERMRMYRRLAAAATGAQLDALGEEMLDRFGAYPKPVRLLLASHRLRLRAAAHGIVRIQAVAQGLHLSLAAEPPCADALIGLLKTRSDLSVPAGDALRIRGGDGDAERQLQLAVELCDQLEGKVAQPLAAG